MANRERNIDQDNLSVVPYDSHRDVVLRHAGSVVYFNPESRQLSLRQTRDLEARTSTHNICGECGRPLPGENGSAGTSTTPSNSNEEPSFINNDYFRMLARSLPGSAQSSAPPSPRRRTIQPARSRLSSTPSVPPPDAEFVGSEPAPPSPSHGISETAFAPLYFEKFFTVEKELGKGGRGVVLLVRHILDGVNLGHFACKRVPIGDDHTWLEKVLVEVQALQALSHQNLVSYRHVWLEDFQLNSFGPSVPCAFILQQYCNGGDLHNYVCGSAKVSTTTQELKDRIRRRSKGEPEMPRKLNSPKSLSFDEIYSFFRDITAGLRFLHLNGFIHRDLKPSNCLLHTVNGESRVLVSDFGEVQYEDTVRKSTGATGTISFCAPEVLRRETPDGPFGNFTFKSDIFSLGMILHFLCFADLPYQYADVLHEEKEDVTELRAEILAWPGFNDQRRLRPELPSKLYSFLKRLLSLNPDDRPSADEVDRGIRLQGLDPLPDLRRRQSASPEELTPGRRVQKLDTPAQGNSPRRGSHMVTRNQSPDSYIRRRKSSHEAPSMSRQGSGISNTAIEEEDAMGGFGMERSMSAPLRSNSIVLAPKVSSPSHSPRHRMSASPSRRPQQFLLPPAPQNFFSWAWWYTQLVLLTPISSQWIRMTLLSIKIIAILHPCLSKGINASILYPLLAFAILDLLVLPYQVWKAILTMMIHMTILWYAYSQDTLCINHQISWDGT